MTAGEWSAQLVTEFVVPDLDRTLEFLVRLGFVNERRTGDFAVLRWDDSYLFIAQNRDAGSAERWANVRVMVSDVDERWRIIHESGAEIRVPIRDEPFGLRNFVVVAPGNVEIRFAQRAQSQ